MPWSGSRQTRSAHAHLVDQHRPQPLGDVVAFLGVQVHRVEDRSVHVVLALVVGAVADPHRARVLVALEVIERRLLELPVAPDPVHDLQRPVLVALQVGEVLHEVVRLPVQSERVQPPQRERRVAHPAVAVVPVARPLRGLRQRGRQRRHQRPRRHERQALQRQRRALQVQAPGMVRVGAFRQPRPPEVAGALQVTLCLLHRARPPQTLRPGDRAEALLAFDHRVAAVHPVALDPHAHVREQAERRLLVHRVKRPRFVLHGLPARHRGPVVEHRLAHHLDLHLPLDALDHPHQQMVGVVVRRRARVTGALLVVVPFADRQRVDHANPALRRSSTSSRSRSSPAGSGGPPAHRRRRDRRGSARPRGPASPRTRSASRSAAGTATRPRRRRPPAHRCGSRTGSRSRRSAGKESPPLQEALFPGGLLP